MKKLGIFKWIVSVMVVTFACAPVWAQCTTFSSQCYFFIEEDICRTWACTYCETLNCCHVKSGHCLNAYQGLGYMQYCDTGCGARGRG